MKLIILLLCILCITAIRSKSIQNDALNEATNHSPEALEIPIQAATEPSATENTEVENDVDDETNVHIWDCPKDQILRHQLEQTSEMLEDGNKVINRQDSSFHETILVLGKPGCGKTSFVQLLAGDNDKLFSNEVGTDSGEFLIEDGLKIGSSLTSSFTLYPDMVLYNSSTVFCDTPGFRDTRSPSHEIVATNVMKKVAETFQGVKIVILSTYNSLQYGVEKDSFTDLLRYVLSFVSDVQKYKTNIALIATKVPWNYVFKNGNATLIPDKTIIRNVAHYLNKVKTEYVEKLGKANSNNEKRFLKNAIELLESLCETDSEGNVIKINIFRRPEEPGVLTNITSIQENKRSLLSTVFNNIRVVDSNANDFDYSLSDRAKNYLDCLLRHVNGNVVNLSNQIYLSIKNNYRAIIENYNCIHSLVVYLKDLDTKMDSLKESLEDTIDYMNYLKKLESFAENENITLVNYENNTIIHLNESIINTLEKFIDTRSIFTPASWSAPMKHVLQYIKDTSHWYQFLMNVFENLTSYKIQEKKDIIYRDVHRNTSNSVDFFIANSQILKEQIDFKHFDELRLNEERVKELDDVISSTIVTKHNITCDKAGRLIVAGYFVKISEINTDASVRLYCGNVQLKDVFVLAVSKVFIDADISEERFRGVNMLIVAPTWEVVGRRDVILTGVDGAAISEDAVVPCKKDNRGHDGKPGLPGGNGGNFFGIGLNFVNGDGLFIKSNGGAGGPGVNGSDGCQGPPAEDSGYSKFQNNLLENSNVSVSFRNGKRIRKESGFYSNFPFTSVSETRIQSEDQGACFAFIDVYERYGQFGIKGGDGGNGGVGGIGGNPGKQKLIHLKDPSKVHFEMESGDAGPPGVGGRGGARGADSVGMTCYRTEMKWSDVRTDMEFWNCVNTTSICQEAESHLHGATGISNYHSNGRLQPSEVQQFQFSSYLFDYALLLENESSNKLFNKTISDFKSALLKTFSQDINTLWRFIFTKF